MEAKLFCFLEIIGVGYKASINPQGSILYLKLGFDHEIRLQVTSSIHVFCFKPNPICCTGIDHQKDVTIMTFDDIPLIVYLGHHK